MEHHDDAASESTKKRSCPVTGASFEPRAKRECLSAAPAPEEDDITPAQRIVRAKQRGWTNPTYYHDYLQLDKLLNAQLPISTGAGVPAHDELLFITTHQTYELWFKQVLHEIDSCRAIFMKDYVAEAEISTVVSRLQRVTAIQQVLLSQFTILETMTPLDFLDFRDFLFPASGFQSVQFRLLENKLGLRPAQRLNYATRGYCSYITAEHAEIVQQSEREPSMHDLINRWLERTPFLETSRFSFWRHYRAGVESMLKGDRAGIMSNPLLPEETKQKQLAALDATSQHFESIFDERKYEELRERGDRKFSHKGMQAALLINLYQHEPILHLPHRLLTLLLDIDELLTQWRVRHALMVHRMLGVKIGTGGSSGYHYLRATEQRHRIFNDLFDLSTFFIPKHALPPLPADVQRDMSFTFNITQATAERAERTVAQSFPASTAPAAASNGAAASAPAPAPAASAAAGGDAAES